MLSALKSKSLLTAFLAILLVAPAAQALDPARVAASATIDRATWTDAEIADEAGRYLFGHVRQEATEPIDLSEQRLIILSGFQPVGSQWPVVEDPTRENAAAALDRRDALASRLTAEGSEQAAALASQLRLIAVERRGEWVCAMRPSCFPTGYVVALLPVEAEMAEEICALQRRLEDFCHIKEN